MACVSRSVLSVAANTCSSNSVSFKTNHFSRKFGRFDASKFKIRASSSSSSSSNDAEEDCNAQECAPDKEVGKVSMEWLADDKTRVVGTFPPRKKGWTGYTEKDTAGQRNIYSVEPTVYVAESAISSGTADPTSDGAENTSAIVAGLALISIAAASSILLQVGKKPPQMQTTAYSGPSLSYYVNKFQPAEFIEASVSSQDESSSPAAAESGQSESSLASEPQNTVSEVPQVPVASPELS